MISILFLFFYTYLKYDGAGTKCTSTDPCNYSTVLKHTNDFESHFVILDKKIKKREHLTAFRKLILAQKTGNSSFVGNTLINGSLSEYFSPAFLSLNNIDITLIGFNFTDFKFPVLHFRENILSQVINCSFTNFEGDKLLGFIIVGYSHVVFSNVSFNSILLSKSMLFSFSCSKIHLLKCYCQNIQITNSFEAIMMLSINSSVISKYSNFSSINSPLSNLFSMISYSNFYLFANSFTNITADFCFSLTSSSSLILESCNFKKNFGSLLIGHPTSNISAINTIFKKNVFPGFHYIILKNAKMSISLDCLFLKNTGLNMFCLKGSKTFLEMRFTEFTSNVISSEFFFMVMQAKLRIDDTNFINNFGYLTIFMICDQSTAYLKSATFQNIYSSVFLLAKYGKLKLSECSFVSDHIISSHFVKVSKSSFSFKNSTVKIESSTQLMIFDSAKVKLTSIIFSESKQKSLSGECVCTNCTFYKKDEFVSTKSLDFSIYKYIYLFFGAFLLLEVSFTIFLSFKESPKSSASSKQIKID
ncbi:hypothetical protein TRFO_21792 [Tritrichomonas foetus]|uniref:Right handed beta helix domain-containing protein n=1 Tax=Tritrichomonas foetus TaxID=1144522 RepID=A0A1J4KD13_9EUKA|nr:hypothetical protein TRFO_21792 [Tritrichomonas foetus]|eukprot:OHT09313.1 hypothetical protein TRFO_21792 [Tritrichomonas foetus]